jgi:hypothetical protein
LFASLKTLTSSKVPKAASELQFRLSFVLIGRFVWYARNIHGRLAVSKITGGFQQLLKSQAAIGKPEQAL